MDLPSILGTPREAVYTLSLGLVSSGMLTFIALLFIPAPYGRYYDKKIFRSELLIPGRLGWFVMESPNLVVPALFVVSNSAPLLSNITNVILVSTFLIHYIYRDMVYPVVSQPKPLSLLAFLAAFIFCTVNSTLQSLALLQVHEYSDHWISSPSFIVGVIMWAFGLFTHAYSDYLLRNLRKPGETGYKVPQGYLFGYVSCANFFGEIVEWLGFALACGSMAGFAFAFYTASNLIPRGLQHHRYYLQKMDDYPKNRKAVIPFIL